MDRRWVRLAVPALVFAGAVVPFLPALAGEFVNWDDVAFIVGNPHWRGLSPAHLAWMFTAFDAGHYQPLSWVSLALDHAIWGMEPQGYHLTSLLLHATSAVLLYLIVLRLLPAAGGRARVAAGLGALLWAVHPLRTESVAWITERRDVLSTGLLLGAFLAYLHAVRGGAGARRRHGLAGLLLTASLLAKAWGMTLAAVLLVVDLWVLGRPLSKRLLLEKLPYLLLGLGAAALAAIAQRSGGATAALADHHWLERVLQAGYGVWFYLGKTVLPVALSPLYLIEEQRDFRDLPRYWVALVAAVGVTVAVFALRRRMPWLAAAWACYLIIVSPVLGLLQSGAQLVADRYSYVSCMPWAVLAGAGLALVLRAGTGARAVGAGAGAALVVLVLAALSVRQSAAWQNSVALWDQAVRAEPANYVAWTNRANARLETLEASGDGGGLDERARALLRDAIADYGRSIALAPGYGLAYASRGVARMALADHAGAVEDFDAAIELVGRDPDMLLRRGLAHRALGHGEQALADFDEVLALDPASAVARLERDAVLRAGNR